MPYIGEKNEVSIFLTFSFLNGTVLIVALKFTVQKRYGFAERKKG